VIFGLGTALSWGLADFGAAVAARKIGSHATVVVSHVGGSVVFFMLFAIAEPTLHVSAGQVSLLVVNGVMAAAAYVLLYHALQLGPVSLISPIVAAYAAVTVALAMILLGESLAGIVLAGAIVTIVGVVLTSTDLRALVSGRRGGRSAGVPFAIASMVMFGVASYILGRSSQEIGWMQATAISRAASTLVILATAIARRLSLTGAPRKVVGLAALVGLGDIAGVALYTRGVEAGFISIVAAASATFTLIPVAGGILFFKERPAATQAVGVALVVAGLLLLGLGN
jgi:drug/metabolite transporter (DMT)-like permease